MTAEQEIAARAVAMRDDAERKAIDALGRYKFEMFGYWAAIWVDVNKIIGDKRANPFRHLVKAARSDPSLIEAACNGQEVA